MTKLRSLWTEGKPTLNGWCMIGNPFVAEIMAAQGFDSVTVDMQHGALDYTDLLPMLQAMRASGATLLARVPWLDPAAVMKALDAGAEGIICPMINTAADAARLVSYLPLPPLGRAQLWPHPRLGRKARLLRPIQRQHPRLRHDRNRRGLCQP